MAKVDGRRGALASVFVVFAAGAFACEGSDVTLFSGADADSASGANSTGPAGAPAREAGAGGQSGADDTAGAAAEIDSGGGLSIGGRAPTSGAGGTLGGGETAGTGAASESACFDNADCPQASFCLKQECKDAQGSCAVRPPVCFDAVPNPVCGCNHVTYWNDCLRQQYGVSAATKGPCGAGARTCYGNNDCKGGANCSHLLPPNAPCAGPPNLGTCWVAPVDCSLAGDKRRWSGCAPPGAEPEFCGSTCEAIKTGRPAIELAPGAVCRGTPP